jgi:bifunctional non-homologous end joining protein LigD
VPKGVAFAPGEKHLAVHVEDHPLEYGSFEGVIPAGEYGGGTVMLWDRGEWTPAADPSAGYRKGRLSFRLHGRKLRGEWTLARMRGEAGDGGKNWLLIRKSGGEEALVTATEDRSVLSGRTMEEIAAARDAVWTEAGAVPGEAVPRFAGGEVPDPAILPGARPAPQPDTFRPQLATLVGKIPAGDDWLHEIKFDGYRLVCLLRDGRARLLTRNGHDWTDRFAGIARAAEQLPIRQGVLDGEAVVLRPDGTTDFQALQNSLKGIEPGGTLVYYLFDLPHCQGFDLTASPLVARKELLQALLQSAGPDQALLRYSDHIRGRGDEVLRHACRYAL